MQSHLAAPCLPSLLLLQKDRHRFVADTESEEEYDADSDIPMSQARTVLSIWFCRRSWKPSVSWCHGATVATAV